LRAGGALAVFVVLYFWSPATLGAVLDRHGDPKYERGWLAGTERNGNYRHLQRRSVAMRRRTVGLLILLSGATPAAAANVEQTTGSGSWCSPTQNGNNNTVICYGVDPRAMTRLNDDLDRMGLSLKQKTAEADEWARKYNILNDQFEVTKKQLAATGEDQPWCRQHKICCTR